MADDLYLVPPAIAQNANINAAKYHEWYQQSLNDPAVFWAEQAQQALTWYQPWQKVLAGGFDQLDIKWFTGAKLNASYNCLDRHLETRCDQIALIWESDDPSQSLQMTYGELYERVCCFANVLKKFGVGKGDTVCLYMPMMIETVIAMLACTRIGAIHAVVFAGFSGDALKARIQDTACRLVMTANVGIRNNKVIPLKENVDAALPDCPAVRNVIVVKRTEHNITWDAARDHWYHDVIAQVDTSCEPAIMDAADPLFILYTSGSTGKPKGILHGTAGYLVYAAVTFRYIFDYHDREVYWCTADFGWITGHTYGVYGPLLNGATTLIFEGVPQFPSPARYWEVIDKHQVNIFYTAPTAIRAMRREGNDWVSKTSRSSLRILGTVGEPINPDAWEWYYHIVGEGRCQVVDTWWQTETGGIMISPLPGATPLKPASSAWPFFGIAAEIVDDAGERVEAGKMGKLVITKPWPGMMQTVYRDHDRFVENYFKDFPGRYFTGDIAYQDADGYFWILGRSDDVIKVSGHRIGTQEVESALVHHNAVSEAAVVAIADDIKGQNIYAFVTLKRGFDPSPQLKKDIEQTVRASIGAIAVPQFIQWSDALPKTRSGKIMRRLLRKIANNETEDLGDLTTLADPSVVDNLVYEHQLLIRRVT